MPKKISPMEDEWFGVQDPKERKKIQDRLAQRARRTRLGKSAKKKSKPSPSPSKTRSPNPSKDVVSLKFHQGRVTRETHHSFSYRGLTTPFPEPGLSQDLYHLTLPDFTLGSALLHHGIILGIPCVTAGVHKSRPSGPHVPAPLRPIQIQLDEVHYAFIDRLPHKDLRHNMVALSDDFNAETFIADLFTMPTFFIDSSYQSWDPSGWSVSAAFRTKWIILFATVDFRIA